MRSDLPTGTVTFLLTDVEGSTTLLHELGAEAYAQALAEHRRVIRDACARHDGVEVDTQGDAFLFAFPTAAGALAAAEATTEVLASGPIQVRVGVHTGTPLLAEEGYVGDDVHRAARIAAAGHGGQVLVSASAATLVDAELRDLGEHRLKDLSSPERIYQLGEDRFPPLKTLYRTNLPVPAHAFLGRELELSEVVDQLLRPDVRLLTLTGTGGTGKTRLALRAAAEVADSYPDGVWWVSLAPLSHASQVLDQVAQVLGATEGLSVRIADSRMLLVLDNFEHVLGAGPALAEVPATCPNVDILVTSRELLQLAAEHTYRVGSFSDKDAASFFLTRARAASASVVDEEAVEELCARLDNLPLALELAAARTRHMTPAQLLERLAGRLDLLRAGRDADPRHATLRATIEWSYDLLTHDERKLFARLAVFAGGCTLEAVESICESDLDVLSSLVDKSLVRQRLERYDMLETIREFAAERLEDSDETRTRRRHAEFFASLAPSLGFTVESIAAGATQRHDVAIAEQNNFRAAIDWALANDPSLGLRLALELENFWLAHGPHHALHRFEALMVRAREIRQRQLAHATRCRANLLVVVGQIEEATAAYEESLELYRGIGDERGMAVVEHRLGVNLLTIGQPERGRQLLEASLRRSQKHDFRLCEAMVSGSLGSVEYRAGRVVRGLELIEESVRLAREVGFRWWEAQMLVALATYRLELEQPDESERHIRAALMLARQMGDRRLTIHSLAVLAAVAAETGQTERAGRLWGAVELEEARAPVGASGPMGRWEEERDQFATPILSKRGPELERGLAAARSLTFEEAIDSALEASGA